MGTHELHDTVTEPYIMKIQMKVDKMCGRE